MVGVKRYWALPQPLPVTSVALPPLLYSANSRNINIFRNLNIGTFVIYLDLMLFPNVTTGCNGNYGDINLKMDNTHREDL